MAKVSTYLNFARSTEEAFRFYQSVFGGRIRRRGIERFSEIPDNALPDEEKDLIMHIELPILGGHVLMGSDAPESMGFQVTAGNNVHISIEPDSREETSRLFDLLSEGGTITSQLQETFWGAYFGSCVDKYGVQWIFNYSNLS
jgi:PhnB protein